MVAVLEGLEPKEQLKRQTDKERMELALKQVIERALSVTVTITPDNLLLREAENYFERKKYAFPVFILDRIDIEMLYEKIYSKLHYGKKSEHKSERRDMILREIMHKVRTLSLRVSQKVMPLFDEVNGRVEKTETMHAASQRVEDANNCPANTQEWFMKMHKTKYDRVMFDTAYDYGIQEALFTDNSGTCEVLYDMYKKEKNEDIKRQIAHELARRAVFAVEAAENMVDKGRYYILCLQRKLHSSEGYTFARELALELGK